MVDRKRRAEIGEICRVCEKRYPGCASYCELGIERDRLQDEIRKADYEVRKADYEHSNYLVSARTKDRRRRKK